MSAINDFGQFTTLRAEAVRGETGTLREVAEQFEALFVQSLLQQMRDATPGDPLLGNAGGSKMFTEMFDQQIAADVASGKGIGLADLLVRQLDPNAASTATRVAPVAAVTRSARAGAVAAAGWQTPQAFINDILPHARRTAAALGVSPLAVLSQAALETGWGQHVMPAADGGSSLNLFGIKAGSGWDGARVERATLEFEQGAAVPRREPFRVYRNLAHTFGDYEALLRDNPRYAATRDRADDIAAFATALQRGGYATDPEYARKIRTLAGGSLMQETLAALKQTDLLTLAQDLR